MVPEQIKKVKKETVSKNKPKEVIEVIPDNKAFKGLIENVSTLNEIVTIHSKKINELDIIVNDFKAIIKTMRGRMGV